MLCLTLEFGDSQRIGVHRDRDIRMTQQFLHGLDVLFALSKVEKVCRKVCPPILPGMPVAFAAGSRCARYKVPGQYGCFPSLAILAKTQSSGFGYSRK
jgi:hypothetical protein